VVRKTSWHAADEIRQRPHHERRIQRDFHRHRGRGIADIFGGPRLQRTVDPGPANQARGSIATDRSQSPPGLSASRKLQFRSCPIGADTARPASRRRERGPHLLAPSPAPRAPRPTSRWPRPSGQRRSRSSRRRRSAAEKPMKRSPSTRGRRCNTPRPTTDSGGSQTAPHARRRAAAGSPGEVLHGQRKGENRRRICGCPASASCRKIRDLGRRPMLRVSIIDAPISNGQAWDRGSAAGHGLFFSVGSRPQGTTCRHIGS